MVKHVLLIKLKDNSTKACEEVKKVLLSMEGKVEMIRELSVGIDFLHSGRSYDVALEVGLDSRDALEAYQQDPYHVDVVKAFIQERKESTVVVDYETE